MYGGFSWSYFFCGCVVHTLEFHCGRVSHYVLTSVLFFKWVSFFFYCLIWENYLHSSGGFISKEFSVRTFSAVCFVVVCPFSPDHCSIVLFPEHMLNAYLLNYIGSQWTDCICLINSFKQVFIVSCSDKSLSFLDYSHQRYFIYWHLL